MSIQNAGLISGRKAGERIYCSIKQAVKRNIDRFPYDFMFEITDDEINFMVSQNVIPSKKHLGGAKPYAFTEQGISMISSVLTNKIAVNTVIFQKFDYIEQKLLQHDENFEK